MLYEYVYHLSNLHQLVFLTNPCRYKQLCWKIGFNCYLGIATNTRLTSGWVGSIIQLAELSKFRSLPLCPVLATT